MLLANIIDVDELAVNLSTAIRFFPSRMSLRLVTERVAGIVVWIGERIGWRADGSSLGLRQALLPMDVRAARTKAENEKQFIKIILCVGSIVHRVDGPVITANCRPYHDEPFSWNRSRKVAIYPLGPAV